MSITVRLTTIINKKVLKFSRVFRQDQDPRLSFYVLEAPRRIRRFKIFLVRYARWTGFSPQSDILAVSVIKGGETGEVWNHKVSTTNVLDCDQSSYSSRIIFSYTFTLEPNKVSRMTRCRDMAIRIFPWCEVGRRSVVNIIYCSSLH